MKRLVSILVLAVLFSFNLSAQSSYTEFQKTNTTGTELTLFIPAGGYLWFLTDNTDANNVKTYVRNSRVTPTDIAPIPNANWNAFKMYYDVDSELSPPVSGLTNYVLDNNYANYVRLN